MPSQHDCHRRIETPHLGDVKRLITQADSSKEKLLFSGKARRPSGMAIQHRELHSKNNSQLCQNNLRIMIQHRVFDEMLRWTHAPLSCFWRPALERSFLLKPLIYTDKNRVGDRSAGRFVCPQSDGRLQGGAADPLPLSRTITSSLCSR